MVNPDALHALMEKVGTIVTSFKEVYKTAFISLSQSMASKVLQGGKQHMPNSGQTLIIAWDGQNPSGETTQARSRQ